MPFVLQYAFNFSRCASRLTPSVACSCVLTRTYPMAVLVRSACDVCECMQTVVNDFQDRQVERDGLVGPAERPPGQLLCRMGSGREQRLGRGRGGSDSQVG